MDTTQVEYDRAQTACATLSLVLYYCMTNSESAATKAFVARTLDEDAPMVLRLHGDSLLNIADFAANNEAHDILTLLLLNQMPNRNADGTVLHTELRRVFDRRDQAKTFRQRVVVELDEPGRIREISDSELPMAHVLAAAKALVANDDVGCSREYDAALAEAEKIPREKTDNQHRQLKRAHRHSMLLDRTNTALSSTGDVWDQVSLSQAVMTQQTIRERYAHVD
jgi:hypothetical protein